MADGVEPPPDISPDRNLGKRESPPPPAARNIDSILGILGNLKAAQDQYEHEKDLKAQGLLPPSSSEPASKPIHEPPPSPPPEKSQSAAPQADPRNVPPTARKRTFGTESAPAPPARNLDSVLGALGALKAAQEQYEREKDQKKEAS